MQTVHVHLNLVIKDRLQSFTHSVAKIIGYTIYDGGDSMKFVGEHRFGKLLESSDTGNKEPIINDLDHISCYMYLFYTIDYF